MENMSGWTIALTVIATLFSITNLNWFLLFCIKVFNLFDSNPSQSWRAPLLLLLLVILAIMIAPLLTSTLWAQMLIASTVHMVAASSLYLYLIYKY